MGQHSGRYGTGATPLTERLRAMAESRRPDDGVFADYLAAYYEELPEFDSDDRSDTDLYAAAVRHWAIGESRHADDTDVLVVSPDRDRDGWHSDRSIVFIVTTDVPFLVDSVRIVLERHGVATHLLVHPMLHLCRDDDGRIVRIVGSGGDGDAECGIEAWTQLEIDRCDPEQTAALQADLVEAVESNREEFHDFEFTYFGRFEVMRREDADRAHPEILERFGVVEDRRL